MMPEGRWSLEQEARSVAIARAAVADFMSRADPEADSSMVALVVSELVTNALVHASHDEVEDIELVIELADNMIHIEVQDHDPALPVRGDPSDLEKTHGRGLSIVDQLSDDWGWNELSDNGKRVWADLTKRGLGPKRG